MKIGPFTGSDLRRLVAKGIDVATKPRQDPVARNAAFPASPLYDARAGISGRRLAGSLYALLRPDGSGAGTEPRFPPRDRPPRSGLSGAAGGWRSRIIDQVLTRDDGPLRPPGGRTDPAPAGPMPPRLPPRPSARPADGSGLHRRMSADDFVARPRMAPSTDRGRARTGPTTGQVPILVSKPGDDPIVNPDALPALVHAARRDIVEHNTFIGDDGLNVVAHKMSADHEKATGRRLNMATRLYQEAGNMADTHVLVESRGRGNDCGLDALAMVAQVRLGEDPTGVSDAKKKAYRLAIADAVRPEDVERSFISALKAQTRQNRDFDTVPDFPGDPANRPDQLKGYRQAFLECVDRAYGGLPIPRAPRPARPPGLERPGEPGYNLEGNHLVLGGGSDAPDDVVMLHRGDHFDILIRKDLWSPERRRPA